MDFSNLITSTTGLVHFLAGIVAMVTGMFVLLSNKGTPTHKKVGYLYAASMIVLNLTAFMIYRLFGKFAVFHWFAVLSCVTLFLGLYPMLRKKGTSYLAQHISFMYWSVIGLYCAFVAETFVRLPGIVSTADGKPMTIFYNMVGLGIGITMGIGVFFFARYKKSWNTRFAPREATKI